MVLRAVAAMYEGRVGCGGRRVWNPGRIWEQLLLRGGRESPGFDMDVEIGRAAPGNEKLDI